MTKIKSKFIEYLVERKTLTNARRASKINKKKFEEWYFKDKAFAKAVDSILNIESKPVTEKEAEKLTLDGDGVLTCPHCGISEKRDWLEEKRKEEWRTKKRVNDIQENKLINKSEVTDLVIGILNSTWEQIRLIPDILVPTLYKQNRSVMRKRAVDYVTKAGDKLTKELLNNGKKPKPIKTIRKTKKM